MKLSEYNIKRKECSNKEFLANLKKMRAKGWTAGVTAYYTKKNIYIEDEEIIYVSGEYFTRVKNDFRGNANSLRAKFDNQIYKITGEAPGFRQEVFTESKGAYRMKLQEWSKGKGIVVINRLFDILAKKTGDSYTVCQIPSLYQNRYGKFAGYFVVTGKKDVYRVNFLLGNNNEEIVSLDKFDKNDDELITPKETLSFEGYNLLQIFNCILDWVKGEGHALTLNGYKESVLKEAVNWKSAMAQFLQAQPNWISDSQSGKLDQALFFKSYAAFCKGMGITGNPGPISYAMKTFQAVLASGDAGSAGKSAAKNVAIPTVYPGSPSKSVPSDDDLIQKYAGGDAKKFTDFFVELKDSSTGGANPLARIEMYKQAIIDMADAPEYTKAGVVAWGRGGTGKTHHAEMTLKSKGMTKGVNYRIIDNVKGGIDVFIGQLYDVVEDSMSFVIVDDCDSIFEARFRTWMLHILADKAEQRVFTVDQTGIVSPKGRKIDPGTEIDVSEVKFIFCTNKDITQLDSAWKSRIESINFDFTDKEMLVLIRDALATMMPDDPNITDQEKLDIYNLLCAATESERVKNVNFRTMVAAMNAFILAKIRGKDTTKAVARAFIRNV